MKVKLSTSEFRDQDAVRVEVSDPGLSAWQRLCVNDAWRDPLLREIEAYLDRPETQALLWQLEADEEYPDPILGPLRELGLMSIFAPDADGSDRRVTGYHMCALNALTARRDTSVAVTLSVNALALLAAYLVANEEQLTEINALVREGGFSSLLLSELSHGSNLLANQVYAERGILDEAGAFQLVADDDPCTHFRIQGEKDLINGCNKHRLMFPIIRTRSLNDWKDPAQIQPMQARANFTLFWLDSTSDGVHPLPRWHTLPARGADISGVRFENLILSADHVLGREHGGMTVAQKVLALSRGGVASLAAGCLSRARDLAVNYASRRSIYGEPIHHLGAIAEHLLRLETLDRTVSAVSVRTTALMNCLGTGAAHYTGVAKVIASDFAEEGVQEGQRVLGARSLLRELPYERLIRDVVLYGVFDGTTHVMLQELAYRLVLEARRAAKNEHVETLERMREIYATPPTPVYESLNNKKHPRLFLPLEAHFANLAALPGAVPLEPLVDVTQALFALVRAADLAERWKDDQELRLRSAHLLAELEAVAALIELCDLDRREALGIPPLNGGERPLDRPIYAYAIAWQGRRVLAGIRDLSLRSELPAGWLAADDAQALAAIEARLSRGQLEISKACRAALVRA